MGSLKTVAKVEIGYVIIHSSIKYRITQIIDNQTVIARRFDNGISEKIHTNEITILDQKVEHENELISISDSAWDEAKKKYIVIKPLLEMSRRTAKDVQEHADKVNVHSATIYRWIKAYERTGKTSSLIPTRRTGGKGKSRLTDEVEKTLRDVIQNFYLKPERPSIPRTIREVKKRCKEAEIKSPGENTIRSRLSKIEDKTQLGKRHGKKLATEKFGAYPGKYSDAFFPLSVIQIDHTPLDITVVDEEFRLAIGRPWITVAIDVYSRMVASYYISMERPSSLSVGLCISKAVLPKESYIAELNLNTNWPIMGIPAVIHVDNAKEFDGHMLERSCAEYGTDLHFRPLDKPNYGAHIERYLGTLNTKIHDLPGTNYSNPNQRSTYDSEDNAVFTLKEIEAWITTLICDVYHKDIHSEINDTPEARYLSGLLGNNSMPGVGAPRLPFCTEKFELDFFPFVDRTIQQNGVTINRITYFADVLKSWIGAKDIERPKYKRKFSFRYDPRDISKIYFFDPELQKYFPVPYSVFGAPPMTLWELKRVQKHLEQQGLENYDENMIFEGHKKLDKMEEEAKNKTKKQRRDTSRKLHASLATKNYKKPKSKIEKPDFSDAILEPFDDIEVN